ncbi:hypothetical protein Taro_013808 [Colocasia esculenta]|uniref:Uncharacterized protein n=1 Tax=Colocasia esculenta TaxID=4460 RepID=A0A843UN92_COLES|nr:hypothetical protein [Colocasia esculenta]
MLAGLLVEVVEVAISVVPVLEAVLVVIVVVALAPPSPIVDPDPEGDLMWWQCRPPPCLLHSEVVDVRGIACVYAHAFFSDLHCSSFLPPRAYSGTVMPRQFSSGINRGGMNNDFPPLLLHIFHLETRLVLPHFRQYAKTVLYRYGSYMPLRSSPFPGWLCAKQSREEEGLAISPLLLSSCRRHDRVGTAMVQQGGGAAGVARRQGSQAVARRQSSQSGGGVSFICSVLMISSSIAFMMRDRVGGSGRKGKDGWSLTGEGIEVDGVVLSLHPAPFLPTLCRRGQGEGEGRTAAAATMEGKVAAGGPAAATAANFGGGGDSDDGGDCGSSLLSFICFC